jgi:uncharacterized protein YlaN (UPF0358 family)
LPECPLANEVLKPTAMLAISTEVGQREDALRLWFTNEEDF